MANLTEEFPNLANEWHSKKNRGLLPQNFTKGSNKKVWWKCDKGHEYEQSIRERAKRSRGCPYCAGKRVTPESSFAGKNPDKVYLWHPTKNGTTKPTEFAPQSGKKAWWRCTLGHEWKQKISHITNGSGCPYCAGKRVTPENSFAGKNPDKVHLWHPKKNKTKKPTDYTHGSDQKVWWICEKGHEWEARIANISEGYGCPTCNKIVQAKRQIERGIKNKGSVLQRYPELQVQWHKEKNKGLDLSEIGVGSAIKGWWICERGHEWKAAIRERCQGSGCPKCVPPVSKLELRILSELEAIFGEVENQVPIKKFKIDITLPSENVAIEVDGYPWHLGSEDRDKIKSTLILSAGYQLVRLRDERLKSVHFNEVIFGKREEPLSIIKKTIQLLRDKILIREPINAKIDAYINSTEYANDIGYKKRISRIFVTDDKKSLDNFPNLIDEWHHERNFPLNPANFPSGSGRKVWWICSQGHEWEATIVARTKRGSGCSICRRKTVGLKYKFNAVLKNGSLKDNFPQIAREWHPEKNYPVTPADLTSGSSEKIWWRCAEGHEWEAIIRSRTKGTGCPYCSGKLATKERNLAKLNPSLAKEWHPKRNGDITPKLILPGSNKKVWWKCDKGHEWEARVSDRNSGTSCPFCNKFRRHSLDKSVS